MELVRRNREWQFLGAYYIIACAGDGYAVGTATNTAVGIVVGVMMALLAVFVMSDMSTRRKITLSVLPFAVALAIAVATAFVIRHLVYSEHNTADRWVAIGAVATFATLVVALLTLPLAIIQLGQLAQGLSRLTQVSEIERKLNAQALLGLKLLQPYDPDLWFDDYDAWVERAAALIREATDELEEQTFRAIPVPGKDPKDQLRARIEYIHKDLITKVRAGYWAK